MPGTNAGTGYPLTLRCYACKRSANSFRRREIHLVATGRTRPKPHGRGRYRSASKLIEYRCLACGHVGWTTHMDAQHLPVRPQARS